MKNHIMNLVNQMLKMNSIWRRALLFSFLFFLIEKNHCQKIIRNSDYKKFDSITIINHSKKRLLNQYNFKNFNFTEQDKVLYNSKLLDFSLSNDTLFFFDMVKEIEEVEIMNTITKTEKKIKSNKFNATGEIFANNYLASLIKIKTTKKTFVKSITVQLSKFQMIDTFDGTLHIQLLKNVNGLPDSAGKIASFDKDIAELIGNRKPFTIKNLEFILPQIINYPKEGFFIVFYIATENKHTMALKLNNESYLCELYPKEGWKKTNNNGYYFQLKVLQLKFN